MRRRANHIYVICRTVSTVVVLLNPLGSEHRRGPAAVHCPPLYGRLLQVSTPEAQVARARGRLTFLFGTCETHVFVLDDLRRTTTLDVWAFRES